MIPAPPTEKPIALYDTECFPNYWLLKLRVIGGSVYSFRLHAGESFSEQQRHAIHRLFTLFTVVSFNGIYYDVPMVRAALAGYRCEQLKWLNDEIIVNGIKPWELQLPRWEPADHIDIMEVCPGAGSQKQYAGRIHCKRMQDLPYDPSHILTDDEIVIVDDYCEHDLEVLGELFVAVQPMLQQRIQLGKRYGLDLRSKSDAQVAEAILKFRCEQALRYRIYKPEIDWNLSFRYEVPAYLTFATPALQNALEAVQRSIFTLGASGAVDMPLGLKDLSIPIGSSVYKMGIGGLHSQEQCRYYVSSATHQLRDIDVASYYPSLILNSGKFPIALGPVFLQEFALIKDERLQAKALQKTFEKKGIDAKKPENVEAYNVYSQNEGGKIQINGTFGKTGSPFSILFAPQMLIQTTLSGQLAILMLIEWFEHYGISVVSANTDGIVIYCPREKLHIADYLIKEWEKRTSLEMDSSDYIGIWSRDVNNYFAVKTPDDVKRKGEYSKAGLIEKKNPQYEICADAVEAYLARGVPLIATIATSKDIRKFVTVRKVNGGAIKLHGEVPRKGALVRDMAPVIEANGWVKSGRKWQRDGILTDTNTAYAGCFAEPRREPIGKVVRWYYSTTSPGPIIYADGKTVSLSYGARPCMLLPDEMPGDIDYPWYLETAENMLREVGL